MNTLITLLKKNLTIITVVLMVLWGVSWAFVFPRIWAAVTFCGLVCPTVNVVLGKKYGIPFAVVGVVWLVIAVIIGSQYGWSKGLPYFLM